MGMGNLISKLTGGFVRFETNGCRHAAGCPYAASEDCSRTRSSEAGCYYAEQIRAMEEGRKPVHICRSVDDCKPCK
jgi:hypothetical protein